jgi:DNA-binding beta-propeller fold protein YncE
MRNTIVIGLSLVIVVAVAGCIDFRPEVKIVKFDVNTATGNMTVTYKLRDLDSSSVNIFAMWSIDGGQTWENATSGGGSGISGLDPGEAYVEYTYVWNYTTNIGTGRLTNVFFRIAGKDTFMGRAAKIGPLTLGNPLVFVLNNETGKLHVINAVTLAQIDNADSGYEPEALAVSHDGSKVYVSNTGSQTLTVYNTAFGDFDNSVQAGASPGALAISPDGRTLFAALENDDAIAAFDISDLSKLDTIPSGAGPVALAFAPDNSGLYAACGGDNSVSIFDIDNLSAPFTSVALAGPPTDLVFAELTNGTIFCYVSCTTMTNENGFLEVFDIDNPEGNHSFVTVGPTPTAVERDESGYFIFVANYDNDTITVVSSDTLTVIEAALSIPTKRAGGAGPVDMVLGNDGATLFVACAKSGEVFAASATTFEITTTAISIGGSPVAVGASPILKQ